jgi:trimethylamine--corrinoid protein Co-methyltransferase
MPKPRISFLNQNEIENIHHKSLEILSNIGIKFRSRKALQILENAGCPIDWEEGAAKIPAEVVSKALDTLPHQFTLAARDPAKDILCGGGELYFTAAAQSTTFRDLETRQRRPSTSHDLIQCARLIDALDTVQEWAAMVVPHDVPPDLQGLRAVQISLNHTTKHFLGGGQLKSIPYVLEMMDAVLGHRDRLIERPLFSVVINPVSPLQNGEELVEATLAWAPYKIPIFLQFLPLAGATSPVTLAGTVLQANAEFLGNITLYQLAEPGWPILWAASAGTMDMTSGRWGMGPEGALMTLALIDMAKYYKIPVNAMGTSSVDAKTIGFQSGMDTVFNSLLPILAGVDNLWGPADLDGATLVDLPYILLASEAVRQIQHLIQGINLDEDRFLFEVIEKMGFQGEYLGDPSTKKYFREEHLLPDLFPRETYEAWKARGQSEEEMAIERVKAILSTHEPEPLPEDVVREIDRIYAKAEKALVH